MNARDSAVPRQPHTEKAATLHSQTKQHMYMAKRVPRQSIPYVYGHTLPSPSRCI